MQSSRFNFWFEHGGGRLGYSAATGALVEIEPDQVALVGRLLEGPDEPEIATDHAALELRDGLREAGFLTDEDDEIEGLRARRKRAQERPAALSLTILPTLACNFRCDYCFEPPWSGPAPRMNRATEEALLSFAARRLPGHRFLDVTWFGGEPTLAVDLIERLQVALANVAAGAGAAMLPSGIVSNGFLLDRATAARLAACGVGHAQITLDGPAPIHDARRRLAGGGPTFERIVANLTEVAEILRLGVRVNVDRRNVEAAEEVAFELARRGLLPRVSLSFAPVVGSSSGACASIGFACYDSAAFAAEEAALLQRLGDAGIHVAELPRPSDGLGCGAESPSGFTIDPAGRLYKCWEVVGAEGEVVGNVFSDEASAKERARHSHWLGRDPLSDPMCGACGLLPTCMGGCPRDGDRAPRTAGAACCTARHNLPSLVRLRARREESP